VRRHLLADRDVKARILKVGFDGHAFKEIVPLE
jgi:hypothetical protein